jgi:hypothetical protein
VIAHRADFSRLHKQKSLDCPFFSGKIAMSAQGVSTKMKKQKNKKKSSIPAH